MIRVLVACGEVPWERTLLAAAVAADAQVVRRAVDLASLVHAVSSGTRTDVVITSPALRGFDERGLHTVAATGVRVLVLIDDIEPPWLAGAGFTCLAIHGLAWPEIFEHIEPVSEASDSPPCTVFVGVSGGVGTTSLAAAHAARTSGSVLIDAAVGGTAVAFLHGLASTSSTLTEAFANDDVVAPGLLTLSSADAGALAATDVDALLARMGPDVREIVIDAGVLGTPSVDALTLRATRTCIVGIGTPLGLVRVCSAIEHMREREVVVIVNAVRAGALGTGRPERVVRRVIEEHLGRVPVLVPHHAEIFDAAWLRGSVAPLLSAVPALPDARSLPPAIPLQVASAA